MRTGIPITTQYSPNYTANFDLYFPTINWPTQNQRTHQIFPGYTVGAYYLPRHDAYHHFAGIPGTRLSDIAPGKIQETKDKLLKIFLKKEHFATTVSSMIYIPKYVKGKRIAQGKPMGVDFDLYNQGMLAGIAPLDNNTYVDAVGAYIFGDEKKLAKIIRENTSSESVKKTRQLGIMTVMPDLSKYTGEKLDSYIVSSFKKYVFPALFKYHSSGYHAFVKYSKKLADTMTQKWYVEWSDDFKFGIPLDDLESRTDHLIEQLKAGDTFKEPGIGLKTSLYTDSWNKNKLRTTNALLGRRIKEAIHRSPDTQSQTNLKAIYQEVVNLNKDINQKNSFTELQNRHKSIIKNLKLNFPISRIYPSYLRSPYLSYTNYWDNPYGILAQSNELQEGFLSPQNMLKKFLQANRSDKSHDDKVFIKFIEDYEKFLNNQESVIKQNKNLNLQEKYLKSLKLYIEESFLPQIAQLDLSRNEKQVIYSQSIERLNDFSAKMKNANSKNFRIYQQGVDNWVKLIFNFLKNTQNKKYLTAYLRTKNQYSLNYEIKNKLKFSSINGEFVDLLKKDGSLSLPRKFLSLIEFVSINQSKMSHAWCSYHLQEKQ